MENFHGLVIYKIFDNGNLLNGVFTNSAKNKISPPYSIDCEIARKESGKENGIEGIYKARYIEAKPNPKVVIHCTIEITKHDEVYEFVWKDKDGPFFKGFGIKVDNDHIAVSYSNAK